MAVRFWEGGDVQLSYDSGSTEPTAGDTLTGATSGATAVYVSSTITSGTWGTSDAAGVLTLTDITGIFEDNELINNTTTGDSDVLTADGVIADNRGDWQTTRNWSDDTVPVANDEVIIDGRGHAITGTINSVTDGGEIGSTGGVSLDLLHVRANYTGDICAVYDLSYDSGSDEPSIGNIITGVTSGASGIFVKATLAGGTWAGNDASGIITLSNVTGTFADNELLANTTQSDNDIATVDGTASKQPLHINPDKVVYQGTGTMWLECSEADAVTDSNIDLLICMTNEGTLDLSSDVNIDAWTAEFTEIWMMQGTLNILDDTNVTDLRVSPLQDRASNVAVTIGIDCFDDKDADIPMNIYMQNGTLTTDSTVNVFEFNNGTVNFGTDLGSSPETDLNITVLRQFGGAFNWQPDDSGDDAFIGRLYLFGGTFDASGQTNKTRAKIIGDGAGNDVWIFPGSTMSLNNTMGNITIAAGSQLWNYGGTLNLDAGAQIDITYDAP